VIEYGPHNFSPVGGDWIARAQHACATSSRHYRRWDIHGNCGQQLGSGTVFELRSGTNALVGQDVIEELTHDSALFRTVVTDGATYNQTTVSGYVNSLVVVETVNGQSITIANPTNNAQYIDISQNMATSQYGAGNFVTGIGLASFGESEQFQLTYAALNSPTLITTSNDIGGQIVSHDAATYYLGTEFDV
jgi:hypothetical protein